jgi:putative addiction module component (TIGR02574 family)
MSSKQNVIVQALELSEADRLEIAEAIFQSIEGPHDPGASAAWDYEIQQRMESVRRGEGKFTPWDQARRRIGGQDGAGGS